MELVQHTDESQASDSIIESINGAMNHGHWMIAVWTVEEDGRVVLRRRTTYGFPTGKFEEAQNLLKEVCDNERKGLGEIAPDQEPLPMADFLKLATPNNEHPTVTKEEPPKEGLPKEGPQE
jgi:hypothetical protein